MEDMEPTDPVNHQPVIQLAANEVFMDPLSTVLNRNVGSSFAQPESKEVVKLQMELLNYQMETAKVNFKRF